jgi:hypothetical protein
MVAGSAMAAVTVEQNFRKSRRETPRSSSILATEKPSCFFPAQSSLSIDTSSGGSCTTNTCYRYSSLDASTVNTNDAIIAPKKFLASAKGIFVKGILRPNTANHNRLTIAFKYTNIYFST